MEYLTYYSWLAMLIVEVDAVFAHFAAAETEDKGFFI